MKVTIKELRMTDADRWTITTSKGYIPQGSGVTHKSPDSFGCIADELEEWCDSADVDWDACDVPRDLVERIRRLAAKED